MELVSVEVSELKPEWFAAVGLEQAILYHWERIETYASRPPAVSEIDLNGLLEGYWFGEKGGLHLYRSDEGWRAVWCQDEDGDSVLDECQLIRRSAFGSSLAVRHYLNFDEDGQAYIVYSRPCRIRSASNHRGGGDLHE